MAGIPIFLPFLLPFVLLDLATGGNVTKAIDRAHAKEVRRRFGHDDDEAPQAKTRAGRHPVKKEGEGR